MLFAVVALADRWHIRDIPRFANVATAEMIVRRRYVLSANALTMSQARASSLSLARPCHPLSCHPRRFDATYADDVGEILEIFNRDSPDDDRQ